MKPKDLTEFFTSEKDQTPSLSSKKEETLQPTFSSTKGSKASKGKNNYIHNNFNKNI